MSTSSTFVAADPDGYERLMGRWSRRLAQPFLDFAGTADHERVLDLGCGTGHLAAAIAYRARPGAVLAATVWDAREETSLCIRMDCASFDDDWAPYIGRDGPGAGYVQSLDAAQRQRLQDAVRAAYLDGEPDGPRSYAALAWAVKGVAPSAG